MPHPTALIFGFNRTFCNKHNIRNLYYWLPFATGINEFISVVHFLVLYSLTSKRRQVLILRSCALILEYISPRPPPHGVRYVGLRRKPGINAKKHIRHTSSVENASSRDEQELPGRYNLQN